MHRPGRRLLYRNHFAVHVTPMNAPGPEILGRLLDEHASALMLFARRWCSTPDDVVQDAFLQLSRQPECPRDAVAWLYRVVRNGAISASRGEMRRRRHEAAAAAETSNWFAEVPIEMAIDAQTAAAALHQLPPEEFEVIVAHVWGGLTFIQIAALVSSTPSTVHRRYQAGLLALRNLLGEPCLPTKLPVKNCPKT
jgi:RNA polymerase sigma-70 factor (ECF subfamily)